MTTHKEIDAEVTFTCMSPSEYRETLVLEKLVRLHDFNDTSDNERDQRERELLTDCGGGQDGCFVGHQRRCRGRRRQHSGGVRPVGYQYVVM